MLFRSVHTDNGCGYIRDKVAAAHADSQAHTQRVCAIISVLRALCDAGGNDLPGDNGGHAKPDRGSCGAGGGHS